MTQSVIVEYGKDLEAGCSPASCGSLGCSHEYGLAHWEQHNNSNLSPGLTSYEAIHGHKLDLSHLRASGCMDYVFQPLKRGRDKKLKSRAEERVLVGYCKRDAYRVIIDSSKRVVRMKDATFDENGVVHDQAPKKDLLAINLDDGHRVMDDLIDYGDESDELNLTVDNAVSHYGVKVAEDIVEDTIEEEIEDDGHEAVDEAGNYLTGEMTEANGVQVSLDDLTYIPAM